MNQTLQKPVYLMAGGRSINSFSTVVKSIIEDTGKSKTTVAYVGVASGDNRAFYLMISAMIKSVGNCQVKRVLMSSGKADLNKARDIMESADAVFMSGGDVEVGMKMLKEKGMTSFLIDLYKRGKLFFGASAGTIMLAREWIRWSDPEDDDTAELFPCLGIIPIICDTHAEADNWEELKAALKLEEENTVGYGIPSGGCLKVCPNGQMKALGVTIVKYVKYGGSIIRQEDLLP